PCLREGTLLPAEVRARRPGCWRCVRRPYLPELVRDRHRLVAELHLTADLSQPLQRHPWCEPGERDGRAVLGSHEPQQRQVRPSIEAAIVLAVGVTGDLRLVPGLWSLLAASTHVATDVQLRLRASGRRRHRLPRRAEPGAG